MKLLLCFIIFNYAQAIDVFSTSFDENINQLDSMFFLKTKSNISRPLIEKDAIIYKADFENFFNQFKQYDESHSFINFSDAIKTSEFNHNFAEASRIINQNVPFRNCKDILDNNYSVGDGYYKIDLDGTGPKEVSDIYCDMTTSGGGWMVIIKDYTTDQSYLSIFGDTSEIINFTQSSSYGVSWGELNWSSTKKYEVLDIPYNDFYITHSGFYNSPSGGLGVLNVYSDNKSLLSSTDAWGNSSNGQSLSVNSLTIYNQSKTNHSNRSHEFQATNSNKVGIQFYGHQSLGPYSRRYISRLMIR